MLSAATILLLAPPVILLMSSRFDSILWRGIPSGPASARDVLGLIGGIFYASFLAAWVFGYPNSVVWKANLPFFLTRPMRRVPLFMFPVVLDAAIMLVAPVIGWAALMLWLRLVNPSALGYLRGMLETLSGVPISAHPSWISLFAAAHMGRWFLAGSLLGICAAAAFNLGRWLLVAPPGNGWRWGSIFATAPAYLIALPFFWRYLPHPLVFLGPKGSEFHTPPSTVNLLAHLAFVVVVMLPGFRFLDQLEM
jgi:hypothetical protein